MYKNKGLKPKFSITIAQGLIELQIAQLKVILNYRKTLYTKIDSNYMPILIASH